MSFTARAVLLTALLASPALAAIPTPAAFFGHEVQIVKRPALHAIGDFEAYDDGQRHKRVTGIDDESDVTHGGGDQRIRDLIFRNTDMPAYMRLPGSRAGALSCLTGIAARTSIEQKRPIKISELVKVPPRTTA